MDLAPAKVDVGKLRRNFGRDQVEGSFADYVRSQLASLNTGREPMRREPQDVVLYGFGRIGRLMARILIDKIGGGDKFRLRAIVVRPGKEGDLSAAPACCAVTASTAPSAAPSAWTKRTTRWSSTATWCVCCTRTPQRTWTTSSTASATPSSWTTRASGATATAWGAT